eukprot:3940129-Rhodomonas_salina.1
MLSQTEAVLREAETTFQEKQILEITAEQQQLSWPAPAFKVIVLSSDSEDQVEGGGNRERGERDYRGNCHGGDWSSGKTAGGAGAGGSGGGRDDSKESEIPID